MSVELKCAGYYSRYFKDNKQDWDKDGFQTDFMELDTDAIGYVLGKSGVTRQKMAIASNCHLQYVGTWAVIAGERHERSNCRDYINWLLEQRNGRISVDIEGRKDCVAVKLPEHLVGWVAGVGASEVRKIEELTA